MKEKEANLLCCYSGEFSTYICTAKKKMSSTQMLAIKNKTLVSSYILKSPLVPYEYAKG